MFLLKKADFNTDVTEVCVVELVFTDSLATDQYVVSSMTFHASYKLTERLGKDPGTAPPVAMELLAGSWLQAVSTALAARWPCSEKRFCSLCASMLMVSCHLFPAGA